MANFLPNELIARMKRLEAQEIAASASIDTIPFSEQALLLNVDKSQELDLPLGEQVPYLPNAYYINAPYDFDTDTNSYLGAYSRQDISSLFTAYAIQQLGLNALDLHALELGAYNGRLSIIGSSMLTSGSLWLINGSAAVNTDLKRTVQQWGATNTWFIQEAVSSFKYIPNYFDLIVYNQPFSSSIFDLSGSNEINEWNSDLTHLKIKKATNELKSALVALKKEGYLFYRGVYDDTADKHDFLDGFITDNEVESMRLPVDASWQVKEYQSPVSKLYSYLFPINPTTGKGFSLTIFKNKTSKDRGDTSFIEQQSEEEITELPIPKDWIDKADDFCFHSYRNGLYLFPKVLLSDYKLLEHIFDVHHLGVCIATKDGENWIPTVELAWSQVLAKNIPYIALSTAEALAYIKGEALDFSLFDLSAGWYVLRYKELSMGWVEIEEK